MNGFEVSTSQFEVQVEGFDFKNCLAVSPIRLHTEKLAVEHGANMQAAYRKGRTYAADVSLTRVFRDVNLFQWYRDCQNGKIEKKSASIKFMNDAGENVATLNLFGVWPIVWNGPALNSRSNSQAGNETVVLAVENVDVA